MEPAARDLPREETHMTTRRSTPALVLALAAALLIATPALAAPTPDAGGPWQLVAHWWDALTAPLAALVGAPAPGGGLSAVTGAALHTCDPNGVTAATSCTEPGTTEARNSCDPDG